MDSLLSNYASSDEEEAEQQDEARISKPKSSLTSFLPPPKTSNLSSSFSSSSSSSKPLFSSLPKPSTKSSKPIQSQLSSNPNPKRVVQFTIPRAKPSNFDDDDDEEEEERKKPTKDSSNSTALKALSSMLPAPKNSLCLAPSAASRRSAVDSDVGFASNHESFEGKRERSNLGELGGSSNVGGFVAGEQEKRNFGFASNNESFEGKQERSNLDELGGGSNVGGYVGGEGERGNFEEFESYPVDKGASGYGNYQNYSVESASGYENYESYGSYDSGGGEYVGYGGNWNEGNVATTVAPPPTSLIPELGRIGGKRGRNEIPAIVEVNQAELIKNRPREDQSKLTGIAFGPAYQPVSTSKGKPSKLHKRKHQIGTLYYDMKQKEMELQERRSKGFLTKAETQAKYGW